MPDLPSCDLKAVKQLFDACEPLDKAGREEILAAPSLDPQLVEEVQRLLAIADSERQGEQQVDIIGRQLQHLSQSLEQGQRLGAYRVEREIGRGGMGIVFLAHRDDGSYQQRVAIKIAPSFASEEELKHFHRERQILAQLQHPNIAMLLDGGATGEQRPYLVMEHIEGSAITDYCEQHQLDLPARLQLFLAVCDAVSFAHSHLVIHRDIKPENVLVTPAGQVKLLDFGVSKILHSEKKNTHATLLVGLTPAYASPEQVKGEATTTATDVYGLGALLYRLLSGTSPHPGDDVSTEQVIRAICDAEPAPVSKAATPGRLCNQGPATHGRYRQYRCQVAAQRAGKPLCQCQRTAERHRALPSRRARAGHPAGIPLPQREICPPLSRRVAARPVGVRRDQWRPGGQHPPGQQIA